MKTRLGIILMIVLISFGGCGRVKFTEGEYFPFAEKNIRETQLDNDLINFYVELVKNNQFYYEYEMELEHNGQNAKLLIKYVENDGILATETVYENGNKEISIQKDNYIYILSPGKQQYCKVAVDVEEDTADYGEEVVAIPDLYDILREYDPCLASTCLISDQEYYRVMFENEKGNIAYIYFKDNEIAFLTLTEQNTNVKVIVKKFTETLDSDIFLDVPEDYDEISIEEYFS